MSATGGHARNAGGLRVEYRGTGADQRRCQQHQREGIGDGQQQQPTQRKAHADRQRIGLRVFIRVVTD
ncbi:hypothetical protein D3C80_720670 [compost metagenome]